MAKSNNALFDVPYLHSHLQFGVMPGGRKLSVDTEVEVYGRRRRLIVRRDYERGMYAAWLYNLDGECVAGPAIMETQAQAADAVRRVLVEREMKGER